MKTKTIGSLIVLLAITSMAATAPGAYADHMKVVIEPIEGSGNPSSDCVPEDISELSSCYSPAHAIVDLGGEVIFSNTDMMPHSWSSGADMTADDVGSVFDSGLLMQYDKKSWFPDTAGEFQYFCMVHPWMTGLIEVHEAMAEEDHGDDHGADHSDMGVMEIATLTAADIAISVNDGAKEGEVVAIDVTISGEHVNYDIVATHNGETILDESGVHSHTGEGSHTTSALSADASDDNPIDVEVTFQGFGFPDDDKTGPIGLTNTAQAVPEFGTIAAMILVVAIVSIIVITSKSRLSLTPRL